MQLQLGMSRDEVISKLAANYKLTKVQSAGDDWIVAEKQNAEIWQGYLGFHDAKLTYASRSWTQGDEDTFAFAQALWRAMSEMDREGHDAWSRIVSPPSPAMFSRASRKMSGHCIPT